MNLKVSMDDMKFLKTMNFKALLKYYVGQRKQIKKNKYFKKLLFLKQFSKQQIC